MIRTALKTIFAHKLRLVTHRDVGDDRRRLHRGHVHLHRHHQPDLQRSLRRPFAGQDVIVQGEAEFDVGFGGPPPIDESVLDIVLGVHGVAAAEGNVGGFAVIYDNNGEAIVPTGPPTLGVSWTGGRTPDGATSCIREGEDPVGPDRSCHRCQDGRATTASPSAQPIKVQTVDGVAEYDLVGIVGFGEADNLAGATIAVFDLETAQTLFGLEGVYSAITVVGEDGVSPDLLRNSIAVALPEGVEAVTAADEAEAQSEALQESLGFLNTALLVFAAVAVFVAAFIIQNTFRIIVRQRQRELALMRAVGATGGQVVWMVAIEALIVGDLRLGGRHRARVRDLGAAHRGHGGHRLRPAVDVGVAGAAHDHRRPHRRRRGDPARRDPAGDTGRADPAGGGTPGCRRAAAHVGSAGARSSGRSCSSSASGLIIAGLFGDVIDLGPLNELTAVGIGALVVFLAVSMLSSLVVPSLARFIGWPLPKIDNLTGTLAIGNAVRKPRRTATTASALMIGLALVAFFFILGDSIKASVSGSIEEGLRADYVISVDGFAGGFSPSLAEDLKTQDEIETTTSLAARLLGPQRHR